MGNSMILDKVKKDLEEFYSYWNESISKDDHPYHSEISSIANRLLDLKIRDAFLLSDLTEEEKKIFWNAVVIARH